MNLVIYQRLKKEIIVVPASLKASFYSGQLLDFNIKIPSLLDIFPPVGIYIGLYVIVIFYSTPQVAQWRLVGIIGFYQI